MKWKRFFREGVTRCLAASCAAALWLFTANTPVHAVSMQTYCNEPPFASAGIKANLLLMMDNSASMYDAAYIDPQNYCIDNTYRDANTYAGYFDRSGIYRYDSANERFVADAVLPSGSCTGNCAALTPYLYVEMTGNNPYRTVRSFIATGNFLNWLAASKVDVQKQVLTGGKWVTGVLEGESRGCDGGRMVKMVPEAPRVTFAVRGPTHNDPDFTGSSSKGGATRIEIYDKGYNRDACLKAVTAWINRDRSELLAQSNACLDAKLEPAKARTGTMPTAAAVYNQVMVDCFDLIPPATVPFDQTLQDLCLERCTGLFGKCTADASLADKLATLDGVCAAKVKHSSGISGSVGYIGACLAGNLSSTCVSSQTSDYCNELRKPALTDPSSVPGLSGPNTYMPSYIVDAGVSNLGDVSGTFKARVQVTNPPSGLIQEFSSSVNFGVMVFNSHGASPTECAAGNFQCVKHCAENPERECYSSSDCAASCVSGSDGGRILSYLNASPTPGDHSSGTIADIDHVAPLTWTPYAEAFYEAIGYFANRSDLRFLTADFDLSKPPSRFACQRNHILILADGMSTADANASVEALATLYANSPTGNDGTCPVQLGSRSLDDLAWLAAHRNIKTFRTSAPASTDLPLTPSQYITTHVIFTGISNGASGQCDPAVLMRDTATSGGGVYAAVSDPAALGDRFRDVLRKVAQGGNSGTETSIVTNGDGSGAVFLQEQFYPQKSFDGGATSVSWVGEMNSLWYYIDPFIGARAGAGSTVRADSDGNLKLTLKDDQVVSYRYDPAGSRTWAYLTNDSDGDGTPEGSEQGPVEIDQVKALWRAGYQLWSRDFSVSGSARTIYTPALSSATTIPGTGLMKFSTDSANSGVLRSPLAIGTGDAVNRYTDAANRVIQYVQGRDFPATVADPTAPEVFRSRKLNIPPAPAVSDADLANGKGVWKLGDIISSTPRLQSGTPLGSYHLSPPAGFGDVDRIGSYASFIGSDDYQKRGTIYAGANDGMLHAFNFGSLVSPGSGDYKAELQGDDLGKEQWAFIPKNALPYLKYLLSPNYRHLYYVDGSLTLADVRIGPNDSWRTVLIGGMGLGGASGTSCPAGSNCVQIPASGSGYSSYFALDVTDPQKPSFMWEFSNAALGFATSGAAIVRSGEKWFAIFGSGPTGPIDENACQFKGRSDRNLKIFVVDLKATGNWSLGNNYWVLDSGIPYAFAGSVTGGAIDVDVKTAEVDPVTQRAKLGNDDAVYLGYTRNSSADGSGTWSEGGVLRLLTKGAPLPSGNALQVNNWSVSKLIDGVGPVTAGVAKLVDRKNHRLWIYFGSGRYFYSGDDGEGQRYLVGVQDRCFVPGGIKADFLDPSCDLVNKAGAQPEASGKGGALSLADLKEIDTEGRGDEKGWFIRLDGGGLALAAERTTVDPLALTSGAVLFTTFQPNKVPCEVDTSYLWRVKYDSGDPVTWPLQGRALVPLSTGGTEQRDLSGAFTDRGNRRGPAMAGKPGGLRVVSNSGLKPLRKIMHIQER